MQIIYQNLLQFSPRVSKLIHLKFYSNYIFMELFYVAGVWGVGALS